MSCKRQIEGKKDRGEFPQAPPLPYDQFSRITCIADFIYPTNLLASPARRPWIESGVSGGKPLSIPQVVVKFHSMNEHRIATRHRVLKAGTIEFGGGAIDCTVRNISATGAALDVTSPLGIPAQFTLVTDGNHLPCRIVWRKEKRIGVTFDQKP
jgi:hypothetical protein